MGTRKLRADMICGLVLLFVNFISAATVYYAAANSNPGSIYCYNTSTNVKTTVYTRPSGNIYTFKFAPWDSNTVYFVNANEYRIYKKSLLGGSESVVYTHSTYVRDIAFKNNVLFFSEATGGGSNGKIYQVNADGTASLFYTVVLSSIGGTWIGDFTFDNAGNLYIGTGNSSGSSLYKISISQNIITRLLSRDCVMGLSFGSDGNLYFADWRNSIICVSMPSLALSVYYSDPSVSWMSGVDFKPTASSVNASVPTWVLPWSVGNITFPSINSTGTVNYVDAGSGLTMNNAPFGGYIGFRHGASSSIPNASIKYYRWSYRKTGTTTWTDFSEPVVVYYILDVPGMTPALMPYKLGPVSANGINLYEFRPSAATLPKPSGGITTWVSTGLMNTEFSGYLQSAASTLSPGSYDIVLRIYSPSGVQVSPTSSFSFVLPTTVGAGGVINTRLATSAELVDGGYYHQLTIDNRTCKANIFAPQIGGSGADVCGMLNYTAGTTLPIQISFSASQPGDAALFSYSLTRGTTDVSVARVNGSEVSATTAGSYTRSGTTFACGFSISSILGSCSPNAAYSENLYVYAKATTGNGYRIGAYDTSFVRAFALSGR